MSTELLEDGDQSLNSSSSKSELFEELPEGFKTIHNRALSDVHIPVHQTGFWSESFHYITKVLCHGNFTAPVEDALTRGIRVLDAGSGRGIWCLEMARDFPQSTFVGIDIGDYQPKTDIPQNCTFLKGDTRELSFEDNSFDYIYQRAMYLSFTSEDWSRAIAELYRVLRPGGWLELFENHFAFERGPQDYKDVHTALIKITRANGVDVTIPLRLLDILPPTLTNIEVDYVSCPVGWKGQIGAMGLKNFENGMRVTKPQLEDFINVEDYDQFVSKLLLEFRVCKTWRKLQYAFGMKPVA